MAEETEERREGWRLEGWLKRAGAAAAAIASLIALGALLWPDDPATRAATLENVSAQAGVPLSEFELRNEPANTAAGVIRLVAQTTETVPPETVPPETTPETEPGPTDDVEGPVQTEVIEILGDVDVEVVTKGPDPTIELVDEAQQQTMQALTVSPELGAGPIEDQPVSAEAVLEIFEDSRTAPGEDGSEPVGVTVDFDVGAVGYKGDRLDVRWSLFSASTKRRVPKDWLRNRRALLLEPEADDEKGSGSFWVPLPRERGRWFVRVSLHDKRGQRITYADTKRFG